MIPQPCKASFKFVNSNLSLSTCGFEAFLWTVKRMGYANKVLVVISISVSLRHLTVSSRSWKSFLSLMLSLFFTVLIQGKDTIQLQVEATINSRQTSINYNWAEKFNAATISKYGFFPNNLHIMQISGL